MRQITDNFAQNHKERKVVAQCPMIISSHARLPQDGHAKFARLSQYKAIRHTDPALEPCGHCANFSCSCTFCSILAAALQLRAQLSCGFCKTNVWVANYSASRMNTLRALQQSCGSLECLAAVLRPPEIAKKMNMSKISILTSPATLFFCKSCGVAHNTVRLPHKTQKFVVARQTGAWLPQG